MRLQGRYMHLRRGIITEDSSSWPKFAKQDLPFTFVVCYLFLLELTLFLKSSLSPHLYFKKMMYIFLMDFFFFCILLFCSSFSTLASKYQMNSKGLKVWKISLSLLASMVIANRLVGWFLWVALGGMYLIKMHKYLCIFDVFIFFNFVYFVLIKSEILPYENLFCLPHIACVGNS